MGRYLARRFLLMLLVIFFILTITFVLAYLIPGDPTRAILGPKANPQTLALKRAELGLDQPVYVQYVRYLGRVLRGDLGTSYTNNNLPVTQLIASRLWPTAQLALAGVFLEVLIGIPIGIIAAIKQRSVWDRSSMLFALFGVSMPSFWLGLMLLYLFAYRVPLFPLGGTGGLDHLILPAITLGLAGGAWYARMLRSSMLDILQADYMRTARAKGLSERVVLSRHALRNSIQPVITMIGMDLGYYLGGILLVEVVFSWPGIGWLTWNAIKEMDIPLMVGTITFAAVAIVGMNFLVDLLYSVVDPRIRLQ
jgi:peptide/nickel transport system permease protein